MKCRSPLRRNQEAKMGSSREQIRAKRGQKGGPICPFRGPRQRRCRTKGPRPQKRSSKLIQNRRHRAQARESRYFVTGEYDRQKLQHNKLTMLFSKKVKVIQIIYLKGLTLGQSTKNRQLCQCVNSQISYLRKAYDYQIYLYLLLWWFVSQSMMSLMPKI